MALAEVVAHGQHEAEACQQAVCRAAGVAVVRFGDHFVTDDIDHGASGEGQGEGEQSGGDGDGEIAQESAENLYQPGDEGGSVKCCSGLMFSAST